MGGPSIIVTKSKRIFKAATSMCYFPSCAKIKINHLPISNKTHNLIILCGTVLLFLPYQTHAREQCFNCRIEGTEKYRVWVFMINIFFINMDLKGKIQGYLKRSTHFQTFILQVLLNILRCAVYRLKGELSKLFSHLTSTQSKPHV
jgi:hypothetical protein